MYECSVVITSPEGGIEAPPVSLIHAQTNTGKGGHTELVKITNAIGIAFKIDAFKMPPIPHSYAKSTWEGETHNSYTYNMSVEGGSEFKIVTSIEGCHR